MKKITLLLSFGVLLLSACYYNNLAELHPGTNLSNQCDTTPGTVTFQNTIQPILAANCGTNNSCHNASASNPKLDTYDGVKLVAADGRLLDAINHTGSASPMPKNGGKLPQCSLKQIEMWVTDGYPNN